MMHPDGTVHFSDLKMFSLSAAHYRHSVTTLRETTPPMRLGTLVDLGLLTDVEPIVAGETRTSSSYKAARAANPPEVEVFTQTEYARAQVIVESVRRDPLARDFLGIGDPERRTQVPLRWETQGVPRSTRGIDVLTRRRLVDLKVTASAQPERFMSHARRMAWHAQLADYVEACRQNGIAVDDAYLVGVESHEPYPVTVLHMTEAALDEGTRLIATWIEAYKGCAAVDVWPGYVQSPVDLDVLGFVDAGELVFPDESAA